ARAAQARRFGRGGVSDARSPGEAPARAFSGVGRRGLEAEPAAEGPALGRGPERVRAGPAPGAVLGGTVGALRHARLAVRDRSLEEAHLQTVGGAWGAAAVQLAADVELDAELLASRAAHGVLPALARAYAAGGEPPGIRQVGIIRRAQHGEDRRRVIGPPDDERDGPM